MSEFLLELYSEEIPPNLQINARNDLETKFKKLSIGSEHLTSKANGTINGDIKDVRDALSGLGYGSEEIYAVTKDLPSETETSELIKLALQKLAINSR